MLILVTGKNSSGKSAFAERLAVRLGAPRCYLATMRPHGAAGARRVARHRAQRAGLGFVTYELPYHLHEAALPAGAIVLVEDVTNLLANIIFELAQEEDAARAELLALRGRARHVVAVTVSGFDETTDDAATRAYIAALLRLNEALAVAADVVVELREGIPVYRKGDAHALARAAVSRLQHI